GRLKARGHVLLSDTSGSQIRAPSLDLDPVTHAGHTGAMRFVVSGQHGRGAATSARFGKDGSAHLVGARYTTCPPGHASWFILTRKLTIDRKHNRAVARDARVDFKGVPIFYWPYLSFPTSSARKSGLLAPRYGVQGNSGIALALPYYWNIAPELDDTLTPNFYSRRGLDWENETRYLGKSYSGIVTWDYLRHDRVAGINRYLISWVHNQTLSPEWTTSVNYEKVSDPNYFTDFATTLAVASQTDLPQDLAFNYAGPVWTLTAEASRYQNLDLAVPASELPYSRLPGIRFAAQPLFPNDSLHYRLSGEIDNFVGSSLVDGKRVDLYPRISYPMRSPDGFFVPTFGIRETDYALTGASVGPATHLTRTLPIVSVDNGLYLDRAWDAGKYRQTLEPRLYYLYIPYVDQNNFPVFDTAAPDFNFANLFLPNRFFGADRVGDANQATLAVTSRLLDAKGSEKIRVSVGQIHYFTPQRVNLPIGPIYENHSDWVAESRVHIIHSWYVRTGIQWDANDHVTKSSDLYLQYEPAPDRILNLGHEYIAGVQDEVVASAQWPVYRHWTAILENQYSLLSKANLESYYGIQYNSCCWAARVYFHRQLSPALQQVNSVMFQFELKGLARLGTPPINPLAEGAFVFGNP
ncbi:MAG TPA: LPS assembly protein LptD, partial [Acidiferrobacteraceae bacterium]|nr:LPS assembly protein LptD [Acidiferrobacteraceae bacterium]